MAGRTGEFGSITDEDRSHFDFIDVLLKISKALTDQETAELKLYCSHLVPSRDLQGSRAIDVFLTLQKLRKIDRENLVFVEEILGRIGRQDLVRDVLLPFLRPDREIPENPELQPGTSSEATDEEGRSTSNAYLVLHGQVRLVQETLNRLRHDLARLAGTRRSKVKFRGYKKHRSILVHFTIPRENTAVLRLMANLSDPRLVFMGVESLQIDDEPPIKVAQGALFNDTKRQLPVDDIEVGCSTRKKQQRAPRSWTRLWALNLFSDALPLHLQVAASLEYQGFSYSLVRALAERDRLKEHQMRRAVHNLRKAEVESNALRQKAEVDSNTLMTFRSKLDIAENRLKEALETNAVLKEKLQQAQEYAEKAARQVATHVTEYRREKPSGGWPADVKKRDAARQQHLAETDGTTGRPEDVGDKVGKESLATEEHRETLGQDSDSGGYGREKVLGKEATEQERPQAEVEGAEPRTAGDLGQGKVTFGGKGTEPGKFGRLRGVVVLPSNEIFVADRSNMRVQVHSIKGGYLRHFPTVVRGTVDKDMEPYDVCKGSNGTLWVVGRGEAADHVAQYNTDGKAMARFYLRKRSHSRGIAVDIRTNHILVTDGFHGEVQVFRPDGSLVRKFGHPAGEMREPQYITVDGEGNILVSDWESHSVYMYDESGKFLFQFGGLGSGKGQLSWPHGICTDRAGNIIVADAGNKRVQKFTRHGEYLRSFSTGFEPYGLAVGPGGQLVVTSALNYHVTVFPNY